MTSTTHPDTLPILAANIPSELLQRPQWVAWRWELTDSGKWTKIPINPRTGRKASTTEAATWGTFAAAMTRLLNDDDAAGVGFVFTPADPYTGVDLDNCRDPRTGEITADAWEIIHALGSYAEVSPTGTGVKVFCRATMLGDRHAKRVTWADGSTGKVEIYDQARFFTMTGHQLEGTPATLEDAQDALGILYRRLFDTSPVPPRSRPTNGTGGGRWSDTDVYRDAGECPKTGAKFRRLWSGDTSDYGDDDSSADLALCNLLRFWSGNPDQVDRLFRQSGLMRPKWDRPARSGETYGEGTVRVAFESGDICRNGQPPAAAAGEGNHAGGDDAGNTGERDAGQAADPCAERVADLERRLLAAQATIDQLQAENAQLQERLSLVFQVQRHKPIKQQAPVLLAAVNEIASATSRGLASADGWVATYRPAIAEKAACEEGTVTKHLDILVDELGLLERRNVFHDRERTDPETGEIYTERVKRLELRVPPEIGDANAVLRAAITSERPDRPAWGGLRPCRHCGSGELVIKNTRTVACRECGNVLDQQTTSRDVTVPTDAPAADEPVKVQDPLLQSAPPSPPIVDVVLDGSASAFTPPAPAPGPKDARCTFTPETLEELPKDVSGQAFCDECGGLLPTPGERRARRHTRCTVPDPAGLPLYATPMAAGDD